MRELLLKYDFAQFKMQLSDWMTSGRMIWGIFGNVDQDQAVKIAENAKNAFNLAPLAKEALSDFRIAKVPVGVSRLDFGLVDSSNDNSALLSFFEHGLVSDVKTSMMIDMISHFLE